jgi:hypothetical protein
MFNLSMTVIYADGRRQLVKVRPVDSVAFEEKYDMAITDAFSSGTKTRISYIYFLAYSAASTPITFEEWLASIEEIEVGSVDDAAPLVPATSAGSSLNSQ